MKPTCLLWLRRDLRLADQPALAAALATGLPVLPVFIWAPEEEAPWAPGAASRWWLHHSLAALDTDLRRHGGRLVIRRGPTLPALRRLARETGATHVVWNRLYEPAMLERDKAVKAALRTDGLTATSSNAALLFEPWTVLTQQDKPYQVFTPYYRTCLADGDPSSPAPVSRDWKAAGRDVQSLEISDLDLLPKIDWAAGFRETWTPGEAGAQAALDDFIAGAAAAYVTKRDLPADVGTSRLSPHLHFGEIGPRQIWAALRRALPPAKADPYLRQLVWREFAHHLLFHFPHTAQEPLRPAFARFPWARDRAALRAWQKGRTGFPIVDAGMRELWHTGWMHNRVRMIVASFLVKDLLIPWQDGAAWFWDTLVDADLANNTLGWQWAAGCGADAAPYFRIFNPQRQSEKFDADGAYLRRWLPELQALSADQLHAPPPVPGYPRPLVDHATARDRALEAYSHIKGL